MTVAEVARAHLPTSFGPFDAHAFRCSSGHVYLAAVKGDLSGEDPVLTRIHSECLTGDVLGSLRCDCGVQLRAALKALAANGRGALIYATGHEGRGIGLVDKLRAYVEQDGGSDTVDANLHLGLPVDDRSYEEAALVLRELGITRVALLTNNPAKVEGLRTHGIAVHRVVPLPVSPHVRNSRYLTTKSQRLGHRGGVLPPPALVEQPGVDVRTLVGDIEPRAERPYVVLKYAQSLDGRIATASGDSRWISGERERVLSHAMRAHCDGIMVGSGTVLADDPQLTVRLVSGSSPIRIVLDSTLRVPADARIFDDEAATVVMTTERSSAPRRLSLQQRGVDVQVVPARDGRVDIAAALSRLRRMGIASLLVEGGAEVITSLLAARLVDRVVVSIASTLLGTGRDAVGDLGVMDVSSAPSLRDRSVHVVGDDLLIAGSLEVPSDGNGHRPGRAHGLARSGDIQGGQLGAQGVESPS